MPLRVLCGPTASGKSAVALHLAKLEGAEILSIDSMKIYRALDIGTAKPDLETRQAVVHHLIDIADPHEHFSVADFLKTAGAIIESCKKSSTQLIGEGGTPLYLKALSAGMFEGPGRDAALRLRLEEEAAAVGVEELHARLKSIDSKAAARILSGDLRRIVRALEVFELTGKPISELQTQWKAEQPVSDLRLACLKIPRKRLYARIDRRIEAMLQAGWLDECRTLSKRSPPISKEASQALGYRTLWKHLNGELTLEEAQARICFDTHHFARRQEGWFKRMEQIRYIEVAEEEPIERIASRVMDAWEATQAGDSQF